MMLISIDEVRDALKSCMYVCVFRTRLFGLPMLIAIKYKGCTYDYLYNSILDRMASVIRVILPFMSVIWLIFIAVLS